MSPSQYQRVILTLLFMMTVVIAPTSTQDAELTVESMLTPVTVTLIPTGTSLSPTLTSTPSPTLTLQPTITLSPTMQSISTTTPTSISATYSSTPPLTPILEVTEEILDIVPISATVTEASPHTPTPEQTAISAPISATTTELLSISGTETATPISSPIVSISPTLTSISATITPSVTPSVSATVMMTTVTPTFQPTATIGGFALRYIQGIATYQYHVSDDAGILLQIYTDDLTLISEGKTNADGIYNIAVPLEGAYWVVFSAEGYRTERIYHTESARLADMMLLAGDLNGDDCINADDINLMRGQFYLSDTLFDLNDDSITDISDVAMLAGNLNPECITEVVITSTLDALLTPTTATPEQTITTPIPMTATSPISTESALAETTELPTIDAEATDEPLPND